MDRDSLQLGKKSCRKLGPNMQAVSSLQRYFPTMVEERMFIRESNLAFYQRWLFDGVKLKDKTVLDIGAGAGLNSFYAACNGARTVICLEPEVQGSTAGVTEKFSRVKQRLGLDNIRMEPELFQSFDCGSEKFDVILLHNSINHLDEPACIDLLTDENARRNYRRIFSKIAALARPGTKLIVVDCSRHNFFGALGLKNPINPTIEWKKHQAPKVWARMLADAGFENPRIRWASFNTLGDFGRFFLGNKWLAFFLKSHFCLTMSKGDTAGVSRRR